MSLAVLGHAGMRTTLDGTLIIKPAYPAERRFYESLLTDPHIAPMRPFIPRFLGTLPLPPPALPMPMPTAPPGRTELLLLENLCSAFAKPNTLDVKLGTVFHDAATHPEKVRRMQKTARETTSLSTGVRLAEFKVHDNETAQPVCTSKAYGKSIGEEELHEGIARFFPAHDESSSPSSSSTLGLPRRLLVPVLRGIRTAIARIRETYALVEMRVVGGSLFIVYEADWARVEQGLGLIDLDHNHNHNRNHEHDHNHNQNHEHEHNHNHIYEHEHEHEHDNEHDEHALYRVRIVDFAHTTVARGLGPDRGVLLGLDTMLRLIDARLMELELGC